MDEDDLIIIDSVNFEPIEDDDWRDAERQSVIDTEIRQDSWVKPLDIFHSRGSDIGVVVVSGNGIIDICWVSDGLTQRCYVEDFRSVNPPGDADKLMAASNKLLPMDSACPDRPECRKSLLVGDFVQSRSVLSRYGSQVGQVTSIIEGLFVVSWRHFKGHKPKDSKTSYRKKYWNRDEIIKAHPNWVESYSKSQKIKQLSTTK